MVLKFEEIAVYLHCSDEIAAKLKRRVMELASNAPIDGHGIYARDGDKFLLCGTIGNAFDLWHRQLSVRSAADALIAQAIGTAAIEKTMDELEVKVRESLASGERLKPRRSPGYGKMALQLNYEIVEFLQATKRIGVSVTDSMTLLPFKSVTAICEVVK